MALQTRKEFKLDSWVVFVDLVKAFDTVNQDMLLKILSRYGLPDSLIDVIKRLYKDVNIEYKVGKKKFGIISTVGVKQGNNLAPILFLFVMQAAMDTLEVVWKENKIETPEFMWAPDDEDGTANGTVTGQKTNIRGSLFNFWRSLYADDGAFIFCNRDDMVKGMSLLHIHFKRFGLLMHVGTRAKAGGQDSKSKTEAMFFPWQLGKPALTKANKAILRSHITTNAADFDLTCENGGYISFTNKFCYLGSILTPDLSDELDIQRRIQLASQAFGSLRSKVFCNRSLHSSIRTQLFQAIVINLLLWGCESWGLKACHHQELSVCFNRWIRAMNGVSKIDRITNVELRRRLDIESITEIMDRRRMNWLEKLADMPATQSDNRLPRMLLGAWIFQGKRAQGGPLKSLRNSYLDLLRKLKFDKEDPVLGSKYGELKYIIDLICNEPVEFNLRVDYGLHSDIREFFENILY